MFNHQNDRADESDHAADVEDADGADGHEVLLSPFLVSLQKIVSLSRCLSYAWFLHGDIVDSVRQICEDLS